MKLNIALITFSSVLVITPGGCNRKKERGQSFEKETDEKREPPTTARPPVKTPAVQPTTKGAASSPVTPPAKTKAGADRLINSLGTRLRLYKRANTKYVVK